MDKDITQKVAAFRKEIEHGRHNESSELSSASGDTQFNLPGSANQKRGTGEELGRYDKQASRRKGSNSTGTRISASSKSRTGSDSAGPGPIPQRPVQNQRGFSETRSDDQGTTARGRIVREDAIPERKESVNFIQEAFSPIPKRGPGRPRKEDSSSIGTEAPVNVQVTSPFREVRNFSKEVSQKGSQAFNWFKAEGRIISETEAESLVEPLGKAFVDYGGYLDQYLQWKLKRSEIFFSDLSYQEGEVLAKLIIRLGKKDAKVAGAVRTVANGNDYINAIIVLWPRISKLIEAMRPEGAIPQRSPSKLRFFNRPRPVRLEAIKETP